MLTPPVEEGGNPSLIWKSIWPSQVVTEHGARWKIGRGNDINIWTQSWIWDDDSFLLTTPRDAELDDLVVSDLMIPGCLEWDEEHVLFNDRDAACILSTPLPRTLGTDKLIWHFSKHRMYTVRFA
ncbi:hypothetical protein LINPERHAP1_LOCUS8442 [Linum perenne]